jgi:hypothetical protein
LDQAFTTATADGTTTMPAAANRFSQSPGPWAPYVPDGEAPWDLRRVVHLHRRAGFAATWGEIQRDLHDGPEASVGRLLGGTARRDGVPRDFEATAALLEEAAAGSGDPARLKAAWVFRMLFGPDPLGERLTLMWHNHFATGSAKVDDLGAMQRQNRLLRRLARATFGELLPQALRDPALLVYLDAPANRKGHPNENLAREAMELFTLGIGHYTEADVKEAARALTGWTVSDGAFADAPVRHDGGTKTILGRRGPWTGADFARMLLEHPATARRLAVRLCEQFMGEGAVSGADVDRLAEGLREHDLDVGWAVGTVLRSRAFFAARNINGGVRGPVDYVVGAARALELFEPPSSTLVLAEWTARLGQDLFEPPNVGGWPGGRAWLTTRAVLGRVKYAAALVGGEHVGRPRPLDALALARRHGHGPDADGLLGFYLRLLLGTEPTPEWKDRLATALGPRPPDGDAGRRAVVLILATPEAQLA